MLQNKNQCVIKKIKIGVIYERFMCEMGLGLSDLKTLGFICTCHAPHGLAHKYKKKMPTM